MGLVTIADAGVLAFVVPTATGGTELVYLTGEPHKQVRLGFHDETESDGSGVGGTTTQSAGERLSAGATGGGA
jgi:hypothetical protein